MGQKEGRFIPVRGRVGWMILTFTYLLILATLLSFLRYFINNPYDLGTSFLLFMGDYFFEGGLLFVLVAPLVLTIVIHKSFLKGILTLVALIFLILLTMFFSVTDEEFGYFILGTFGLSPILIGIAAVGVLIRPLFKIRSMVIKSFIFIAPLVIMGLVILFTLVQAQEVTLQDCQDKIGVSASIRCYEQFAKINTNPELCNNVERRQAREWCFTAFAVEKRDISICDRHISEVDSRRGCFWSYGEIDKSTSTCDSLQLSDDKDACYYGIVISTEDVSICQRIEDSYQKGECTRRFA